MSLHKLTTKELEEQIDQFRERSSTLKAIINEIKDLSARATLQLHVTNYEASLKDLRNELEKRNCK